MAKVVVILGRQPALGLAELESLVGADKVKPIGTSAALVDREPADFPMQRLGGTIKACKLLTELPFTDWQKITRHLTKGVPKYTRHYDPGKITFGISAYGLKSSPAAINATALSVKKAVRNDNGRPVRVVPNKESVLSSAQVLHNKMTERPYGIELVLVRDGNKTWMAQTFAVQDIGAYAARDQARPKRDARVGMLPPKLAQIIVNLAVGDANPRYGGTVLDPFCGTGVVLQEASLMGFDVSGSDIDERMISYAHDNLVWLTQQPDSNLTAPSADELFCRLDVADATSFEWKPIPNFIACETYLGRPFSALPKPEILAEVMQDVDTIHRKFLQNIARQTEPGFRMCIAVPAWVPSNVQPLSSKVHFKHLKTLENLAELGYTRVSFAHVRDEDLIYHREGQIVARELVVLIRR
jgi:tRNA G10  N-methylase Trm11